MSKKKPGYAITYDIVTPESAEEGDVAERGWVQKYEPLKVYEYDYEDEDESESDVLVRRMATILRHEGADDREYNNDGLTYVTRNEDYRTGEVETHYYHLDGWTPSQIAQIKRLVRSR